MNVDSIKELPVHRSIVIICGGHDDLGNTLSFSHDVLVVYVGEYYQKIVTIIDEPNVPPKTVTTMLIGNTSVYVVPSPIREIFKPISELGIFPMHPLQELLSLTTLNVYYWGVRGVVPYTESFSDPHNLMYVVHHIGEAPSYYGIFNFYADCGNCPPIQYNPGTGGAIPREERTPFLKVMIEDGIAFLSNLKSKERFDDRKIPRNSVLNLSTPFSNMVCNNFLKVPNGLTFQYQMFNTTDIRIKILSKIEETITSLLRNTFGRTDPTKEDINAFFDGL